MRLAKQHLDVGLFTTNEAAMLKFWQEYVGLAFEETLPLGGGVRQHRHSMNGSVLKLNAVRDALNPAPPSGYRELLIARAGITQPNQLVDPDGNTVVLVAPGYKGVTGIAVRVTASDVGALRSFYGDAMQMELVLDDAYRCGDSLLFVEGDTSIEKAGPLRAPGFRYLTVQVWDVEAEHAGSSRVVETRADHP